MASSSHSEMRAQLDTDMAECLRRGEAILEGPVEQFSREAVLQFGADMGELNRRENFLLQNDNSPAAAQLFRAQPAPDLSAQNRMHSEALMRRLNEKQQQLDDLKELQELRDQAAIKDKIIVNLGAFIVWLIVAIIVAIIVGILCYFRSLIAHVLWMIAMKFSALMAGLAEIPFELYVEPLILFFCQLVFGAEATTQAYEDSQAVYTIRTMTTIVHTVATVHHTVTVQAPCTAV